jgi:glycerate 2-kinase
VRARADAGVASIPSTVLVAPDSFKGTMSALTVAGAIGRGLEGAGWTVDLCPLADGGEGTLEVLREALDAKLVKAAASDPLGRQIEASLGLAEDGRGRLVAIVEMAAASGLALLGPGELDPFRATTAGTGELIVAARDAGARLIYVAVGGSATTDGGSGAVDVLQRQGGLGDARLVVLCDVRTPFELAAQVYGPQKGASADDVRRLTRRLHALARRYDRDPRGLPMTGAAGGLSGGLWAEFGAELVPGAPFVLDLLDFDQRMRSARAVVTGEGRLDLQSLAGKLVSEVAVRARQAGVPCHAIVGARELDAFGARILDLQAILKAGTPRRLAAAGRRLAGLI